MNRLIETIKNPRVLLLKLIQDLSTEQFNEVPAGFNNNIIWNLGHMISAQQGLCYKRSGLDIKTDQQLFLAYRPETKPEEFVDSAGVDEIKSLLLSTIDKLDADYSNNLFTSFGTFTTRYGIELSNIDDVLRFLPFHEGLHIGCILALKKLVTR